MLGIWVQGIVISMFGVSLGIMLPGMTSDLNISPVQAGILGSAFFLGSASTSLPASIWVSRYSPKKVTVLALLGAAALVIFQGWSPTFMFLLLGRFLFQLAIVARMVAETMIIQQWFDSKRIALVVSLTVGIFSLGQLMALTLVPVLLRWLDGWRNVYYLLGLLLVFASIFWWVVAKDKDIERLSESGRGYNSSSPVKVLREQKIVWVIALAPVGAVSAFASVMTFWPTFALEVLPLSLEGVGALLSLFTLGGMMASFMGGPLSNLIKRRRIFILGPGILLPLIYVVLFNVTSTVLTGILLFAAGWNAMIWVPIIRTIQYDLALPPRETAVVVGLFMTIMPIGGAVGPPIVGLVQETFGSLRYGLTAIAFLPLTLFVFGLFIPETSPFKR